MIRAALLCLLVALVAPAHAAYKVELWDSSTTTLKRFQTCTLSAFTFRPGQPESSYLYLHCSTAPTTTNSWNGGPGLVTSKFDEIGITWGIGNAIVRNDCRLYFTITEIDDENGEFQVECGSNTIFKNGFEVSP